MSLPRQPIPDHVLADLHADNLPADTVQELQQRVATDPDARKLLDTLDQVTAVLGRIRDDPHAPPAPPDIVARMETVLEGCADDEIASRRTKSASSRRRISRKWVTGLSAAAAVLAVLTFAGVVLTNEIHTADNGPDATALVTPPVPGTTVDSLSHETLLMALGRDSVTGRLADRNMLSQCLTAANATGPILGQLNIDYQGEPAVLVLVGSERPGGIAALVLGTGCTGNDPAVLARTELR